MSALVLFGSVATGFLGAASGLGGAVLVIPALTIGLGVDLRYAIGAGLISALTTSLVSLLTQMRFGSEEISVGAFLEVVGAAGTLAGALLSPRIPLPILSALLGLVVLQAAIHIGKTRARARRLPNFNSDAPRLWRYAGLPAALFSTGLLSGLLGVGGGSLYSAVLRRAFHTRTVPATPSLNALIGVTAALSASIYLSRGYVHPLLAFPVLLGALAGALLGTRPSSGRLYLAFQPIFAIGLAAFGIQLLLNAWQSSL